MNSRQQARSSKSSSTLTMNSVEQPMGHQETEPPPDPKFGNIVIKTTSATNSTTQEIAINDPNIEASWPSWAGTPREIMIVPLSNPEEFLAFGLAPGTTLDKVAFVAWGVNRDHLESFMAQMEGGADSVTFYAEPPQTSLRDYISTHFSAIAQQSSTLKQRVKGLISAAFPA